MFGLGGKKDKGQTLGQGGAQSGAQSGGAPAEGAFLRGLMQDWPLTCDKVLEHAKTNYPHVEIVTRTVEDGSLRRSSYGRVFDRAKQVSAALQAMGVGLGDRVGTMAWNTDRHLEVWYGALGIGAVYHTVNPRLFPEQIIYIMNHAEDKVMAVDLTFVPLLEKIQDHLTTVEAFIVLTDGAHMPETTLKNAVAYEDWIAAHAGADPVWGDFDENAAAGLCYTSGTTGDPKGVLYSHRSNVLHGLVTGMGDLMGCTRKDTVLPVVPMFHANAWGLSFLCPMVGAKMVMPGADMSGQAIFQLLDGEQVTLTAAVPTVWLGLLQYLDQSGGRLDTLKECVIGGSAVPRAIVETFKTKYDVNVVHAWGMTEMSPLGTVCRLAPEHQHLDQQAKFDVKLKQGTSPFSVEMKIVDDEGRDLPRDGKTFGRLLVRGPAVASGYFKRDDVEALDADGWFDTGDVAHIDELGYMQITDRAKDVIKSGGEWISSIDLENAAVGHPKAAECAVIGLPHPKWDERPLLIVVLKPGETATKEEFIQFLADKVAKWWLPDDVVFVDEIPHTATGKIQKRDLREQFKDHLLPDVQRA